MRGSRLSSVRGLASLVLSLLALNLIVDAWSPTLALGLMGGLFAIVIHCLGNSRELECRFAGDSCARKERATHCTTGKPGESASRTDTVPLRRIRAGGGLLRNLCESLVSRGREHRPDWRALDRSENRAEHQRFAALVPSAQRTGRGQRAVLLSLRCSRSPRQIEGGFTRGLSVHGGVLRRAALSGGQLPGGHVEHSARAGQSPAPHSNYYAFEQPVFHRELSDSAGPAHGWGDYPDRYSLFYTADHYLARESRPRFLFFMGVTSHAPRDEKHLPPLAADYRELSRPAPPILPTSTATRGETGGRLRIFFKDVRSLLLALSEAAPEIRNTQRIHRRTPARTWAHAAHEFAVFLNASSIAATRNRPGPKPANPRLSANRVSPGPDPNQACAKPTS